VDIEEARRLRERYESVLDDAEAARAAYHDALKELHRSGVSLREIAEQLGISHQRVHQIIGAPPPEGKRRGLGRVAGVLGAIATAVAVVAAIQLTSGPLEERREHAASLSVNVFTQGQSWRFSFPDHGVSVRGSTPALVLPSYTQVSFALRTADVPHSFWIPRLAGKQDFVPSRVTTFTLDSGQPGVHTGADAEFAGLDYQLDKFRVIVVSPLTFEEWLQQDVTFVPRLD
jgi:heme/copper-type cytochrome/quinol oxidase subunit 2